MNSNNTNTKGMNMNANISRRILSLVASGLSLREAFDAVLGKERNKTAKQRINKLNSSIELQRRVIANLEKSIVHDAGKTIELSKRIIATLEAQKAQLEKVNA